MEFSWYNIEINFGYYYEFPFSNKIIVFLTSAVLCQKTKISLNCNYITRTYDIMSLLRLS